MVRKLLLQHTFEYLRIGYPFLIFGRGRGFWCGLGRNLFILFLGFLLSIKLFIGFITIFKAFRFSFLIFYCNNELLPLCCNICFLSLKNRNRLFWTEPFDVDVAMAFTLGFVATEPSLGDNDLDSSSDSSSSSSEENISRISDLHLWWNNRSRQRRFQTLNESVIDIFFIPS